MVSTGNLYMNVMAKLKFEPSLDESNITAAIKTKNGVDNVVVLGGKVATYAEKTIAEEAVEKIKSVKGVANEIEVDLSSKYKRSDADIIEIALKALKWTVLLPHEQLKIAVDHGVLTLIGKLEYLYQKRRAYDAVKNLPGVTAVINDIKVAISATPSNVKEKIREEFERNARIDADNIQVSIEGSEVTLTGKVKNFDEFREAREAVWNIPGVTNIITTGLNIV
jgi:osmotically-inducible protein OsmY